MRPGWDLGFGEFEGCFGDFAGGGYLGTGIGGFGDDDVEFWLWLWGGSGVKRFGFRFCSVARIGILGRPLC